MANNCVIPGASLEKKKNSGNPKFLVTLATTGRIQQGWDWLTKSLSKSSQRVKFVSLSSLSLESHASKDLEKSFD